MLNLQLSYLQNWVLHNILGHWDNHTPNLTELSGRKWEWKWWCQLWADWWRKAKYLRTFWKLLQLLLLFLQKQIFSGNSDKGLIFWYISFLSSLKCQIPVILEAQKKSFLLFLLWTLLIPVEHFLLERKRKFLWYWKAFKELTIHTKKTLV